MVLAVIWTKSSAKLTDPPTGKKFHFLVYVPQYRGMSSADSHSLFIKSNYFYLKKSFRVRPITCLASFAVGIRPTPAKDVCI